jgi:hypothetical protein
MRRCSVVCGLGGAAGVALVALLGGACRPEHRRVLAGPARPVGAPFTVTLPEGCVTEVRPRTPATLAGGQGWWRCPPVLVTYAWGNAARERGEPDVSALALVVDHERDSLGAGVRSRVQYRFGRSGAGALVTWSAPGERDRPRAVWVQAEGTGAGAAGVAAAIVHSVTIEPQ